MPPDVAAISIEGDVSSMRYRSTLGAATAVAFEPRKSRTGGERAKHDDDALFGQLTSPPVKADARIERERAYAGFDHAAVSPAS